MDEENVMVVQGTVVALDSKLQDTCGMQRCYDLLSEGGMRQMTASMLMVTKDLPETNCESTRWDVGIEVSVLSCMWLTSHVVPKGAWNGHIRQACWNPAC